MKKPPATSIDDVTASKRAERLTNARLTMKRAEFEVRNFPAARHTPLVKDLKSALDDLIVELEFVKR